jgi:hypothetical protein
MNPLFVAMSHMLENSAKQCESSPPPASASTVVTNDLSTVASTFQMGPDYWSGILYPHDPLKIPVCTMDCFRILYLDFVFSNLIIITVSLFLASNQYFD